jgi:nucleoside-diphosphate-sugar epimerase
MAESRRVLLLGASGFLGRHVHRALDAAGDVVLDVGGPTGEGSMWDRVDLVSGDVAGCVRVADPAVVVNCAGRTVGSADELERANVTALRRLLDAVSGRGIRLVHLGSAAEYGPATPGDPSSEDDTPAPASAYGRTKLRATELVVASGVDATVLRVFNPVGAGMALDTLPGRAAQLIADALERREESITLGSLSARRDFIDARDVADAVVAATRVRGGPRVINVGTGRDTLARTLVMTLAGIAGYTGSILEHRATSPRSARVDYQCADVRLATASLGWKATRTLPDAVTALWTGRASRDSS